MVLAMLVAAGMVWDVARKLDMIPRLGEDTSLDSAADDEPRNYLVVGSDSREDLDSDAADAGSYLGAEAPGGQRADVIMMIRVDPSGERLDVVSFPRDLWLPIAGTDGSERINAAYAEGPQQLIDTIRQNFDVEIHHYVEIDFQGFKGIVDVVGGVPMYFDRPMRDGNSGLLIEEPGCVTLDGDQALAFARARHLQYQNDSGGWSTDPTGDLGRIERQQVFIRRMFDKVAGSISLTDVRAMGDLLDVAIEQVTIDRELEVTKAINVARQFGTFEGESIVTHSLPVERFFTDGGADVLRVDEVGAMSVLNAFRDEPRLDVSPSMVTLDVENGSGVSGQADEAATALRAFGFEVDGVGDAGTSYDETTVRYAPGLEPGARAVARHLEGGARLVEDPLLPAGSVVLDTGSDFTGVRTDAMPADDPAIRAVAPEDTLPDDTGRSGGSDGSDQVEGTTTTVGVSPGEPPEGVTCE